MSRLSRNVDDVCVYPALKYYANLSPSSIVQYKLITLHNLPVESDYINMQLCNNKINTKQQVSQILW